MHSLVAFLKSKVALALLGAILIGGTSAILAARTAPVFQINAPNSANVVGGSNSTNATDTATSAATNTNDTTTATATSSASVTVTSPASNPSPTATVIRTSVQGTITAINGSANTFTVSTRGGSYTIVVNSNTTFAGNCTTFSGLQTGWQTYIHGQFHSDGNFHASSVYSFIDH